MNVPTLTFRRLAAMTMIACAVAFVPSMGIAATVSPAALARAATAASVPRCATASLRIWVGRGTGAMGTVAVEFGFTNRSAKTCSLYGYPRVEMLTKSGQNLSTSDEKGAGYFDIQEKTVVLASGKTAYFGILYTSFSGYANVTCPESAALKITPPQDIRTITVHKSAQIAPYGTNLGHTHCGGVWVTPVTAKRFQ
ncbi:MAG: DUF4232 domain-containing protein [Acidimicrobiales bacterium]